MKRLFVITTLTSVLTVSANTAETKPGYWDLRLSLGSYPGLKNAKYTYSDHSPDTEGTWKTGTGSLDIFASHRLNSSSPHSGFIQFGLFLRGSSGENDIDSEEKIKHSAIGVSIGGGYSFQPNKIYSLEIGPRIGLGSSTASEEFRAYKLESKAGGYFSIDLSASNSFNLTEKLQVSVVVGVASWASKNSYDAKSFGAAGYFPGGDAAYSGAGAYINIGLGLRL